MKRIVYSEDMKRKAGNNRPRPSYEEGKLRDPKVAAKLDLTFKRGDLRALIKKAATTKLDK